MALLEVKNIEVYYGVINALKGISFEVNEGEIVTLIGANGAGKTTTMNSIMGFIHPKSGEILFEGQDIAGKPAHQIAKRGIMQSPEGRHVFMGLSVEENLKAGAYGIRNSAETAKNFERVYQLFPRLKERAKQQSGTLSGGEQQMLAIGRALMGSPRMLLLDEPSLGLAPMLIKDIFDTLKKIREEGTTILIVEQNALATLKIADYAYVLELGKISMHGKAADLIKDERLIEAYLGG